MYKTIENDPYFTDIKSQQAKENLNFLVDYLCSMPVAEKKEKEILLTNKYKEYHNNFANSFYSIENLSTIKQILENRTVFKNIDSEDENDIDGYAHIYELDREKLMELGTMRFYKSVATMEHELIHLLMALNNNNPKPQHTEVLSLFGELLSLIRFSQKYNNQYIYENAFINRCINRM